MYGTVMMPAKAAIRQILTGTPKPLGIALTHTKQSTEGNSNRDTNTIPSNAFRRSTLAGLSQRRLSRAAPIPNRQLLSLPPRFRARQTPFLIVRPKRLKFAVTHTKQNTEVTSNRMKITTSTEANSTLNPVHGLALSALATLASPPQLVANINAQTTLMVTPISLDTASSAELDINLALSEPSSASATGGPANSSFVRQDLANTVANANVQTTVQVDSMKLFQVSSLSMDITHAQSAVPVPVVGWVYDSIFGTVPWMNDHLLAIQRQPKTIQNRAVVVVRAVVVPTAMDLGLSIPFRSEQISDPITSSSLRLSTLGENQCMTKIRLSKILDQE
jgi:hypothetical protein